MGCSVLSRREWAVLASWLPASRLMAGKVYIFPEDGEVS